MATIINASTSAGLIQTADTSGTLQLQSNGVTQQTIDSTGSYGQLKQGTAQASTSGTSITFTGIPSWAKRITVMFQGVSTSGTSNIQVQLGAGSTTTSGYTGGSFYGAATSGTVTSTTGLLVTASGNAAATFTGIMQICLQTGNSWVSSSTVFRSDGQIQVSNGVISLSGTLDRAIITTVNGTDTFDAGSINILWEG